jgi:hypothetical protein
MAKREPKQRKPCDHPVADWRTVGTEHRLVCRQCSEAILRQFAGDPVPTGVLFKGRYGYGPFDPKGWV